MNYKTYNLLKRCADSNILQYILAFLAFLEASFFFILPDFFIFPLGVLAPKKIMAITKKLLVCSLLGTAFYIFFVTNSGASAGTILLRTPFVNADMLQTTTANLNSNNYLALLTQSVSGIPVKVWTFAAVQNNFDLKVYFVLITISRTLRMLFVGFLAKFAGEKFAQSIRDNILVYSVLYVIGFFVGLTLTSL